MPKAYKSHLSAAIHETCELLHEHGVIDKETMAGFDATCLEQCEVFFAEDIRALREKEGVSHKVFARHLNITPGLLIAWEEGKKKPNGPAMRLLALIKHKGLDAVKL